MRKNLLLIVLAFSLVLFFSNLGFAQHDSIYIQPVNLNIHPCLGGGTVELNIMVKTVNPKIVAIQVPLFVGGTSGPTLNTDLTGNVLSTVPELQARAFALPSLVYAFSSLTVNELQTGGNPLMFSALDFGNGIALPSEGRFCKMFYDVTNAGTITFTTGFFNPAGYLGMDADTGAITTVTWGGPYSFDVVPTTEQAPDPDCPATLIAFKGDLLTYAVTATDAGGTDIQGAFIQGVVPDPGFDPTIDPINPPPSEGPWTIEWATGSVAAGVYDITVGVYDECETTYCTTTVTLKETSKIWIGTVDGEPCEIVDVPVYLIPTGDFGAFDLRIEFDPTVLYFLGVKKGADLPQGWELFTYRQLPCPMCGCCKYKLLILGLYDIKDQHQGVPIYTTADTLEIAVLEFKIACDQNLRGFDLNICFEFDDEICTENTFSDVDGNILFVSDNPDFYAYPPCPEPGTGIKPLLTFLLFSPPGTYNPLEGRPCGGVQLGSTVDLLRGDINLNGIAYDPADLTLFSSYFILGTGVFTIDEDLQIANTDINADGFPLSLSDFVYMLRVMLGDATKFPKPTPGSDLATIYVTQGTVTTNATLGAALLTFKGEGKVSSDLTFEQGMVDGNLKVLVYMNSGAGITGELLTVSGATLEKVEAVDNFGRPVKTTLVNKVIPTAFALHPNYPNPFNPTTNISFALPVDSKVSLKLYNIAGQLVRTLVNETMPAGNHTVTWNGNNSNGEKVASGIYFYKLNAGNFSKTMKMVMTK